MSVLEKTEQSQKKDDKLKRKDHKGQIPLAPTQQKDKVQLEIKMRKGLDRQKRNQLNHHHQWPSKDQTQLCNRNGD